MNKIKDIKHWENRTLTNIVEEIDGKVYIERWKDIPEFEGRYQISTFGRVKSLSRIANKIRVPESILKLPIHRLGYLKIRLALKGGMKKSFFVHRLVAAAFLKNHENKITVNHKNGNKKDNRYMKLEYSTLSENILHAFKNGLRTNLGRNHPGSKLTDNAVIQIRKSKKTAKEIAPIYGVSIDTIYLVRKNKIWSHV